MAPSIESPPAFRIVRGALAVAASSYFTFGFGFVANLLLVRVLSPADFGTVALARFFAGLVSIRPKAGIGTAFARWPELDGRLVGTHFVLDLGIGVLTLLLATVIAPILLAFGYAPDIAVVTVALAAVGLTDSVHNTARTLLERELRFTRAGLVDGLIAPLSYLPAFWLAFHGAGYWSLVVQSALAGCFVMVGLWWIVRREIPEVLALKWQFDWSIARGLIRAGAPVGGAAMLGIFLTEFDNFLVGTFGGVTALGFYDRAYRIAQWPTQLVTVAVSRVAFFAYVRMQDDVERLRKTATMSIWIISTLALPIAVAVFAAAPDLVTWLFGERWLPSATFLRFLIVSSVLRPMLDDAFALFVAIGRPRVQVQVIAVQAAVLVTVGLALTLWLGAIGTASAVGICYAVGFVLAYRSVSRLAGVRLRSALLVPSIAATLTLGGYFVLVSLVDLNELPVMLRVIVKSLYSAGAYYGLTLLFQRHETVERVRYVIRLARARHV